MYIHHASTVGIRSVVGPIAGSGMLEAVQAQHVEPVRVRLPYQELSGEFSHSLSGLAPLQQPVIEDECGPIRVRDRNMCVVIA